MCLYYIMEDDKMNKDLILAIEALEKENGISVIDLCISKYADWVRITIFFT